jgi:elongation factor G
LGADFLATVDDVRNKLGADPAIMALPIGAENSFKGVVLLLDEQALEWKGDETGAKYEQIEIPTEMADKVKNYREKLVEQIAGTDDKLTEKFLNGEDISVNELKTALRKATVSNILVPIYCGSSLRNKGVQPLLDAVVEYLPSPMDIKEMKGVDPNTGEEVVRKLIPDEKFSALAFKVQTDPHVGRLTYARVYSGKMQSGSYIYNATQGEKDRVGRLLLMHANQREEISEAQAGEIVAIVGIKNTRTGDTLTSEGDQMVYEGIDFTEPVISLSIEPKTKADQEKMGVALNKLLEEDPTLRVKVNPDTGQTIISGMGELHLEILVDRMKREFNVDANVGNPQVAYKETINQKANAEGKYIRQSGGRGQYGHCLIRIEPKDRGEGFEFLNEVKGGSIPREFIPAIEKGVIEAMENGVLAGYPLVDMAVAVYDGSYHEVDSSEIAFKIAGSAALQDAVRKASPVLLEPIMKVEITTPEEYMGDVIGDLSSKRAQILGNASRGAARIISSLVPLAELTRYATILRSMTKGRASYYMEPSHYAEVPNNIAEEIVSRNKPNQGQESSN